MKLLSAEKTKQIFEDYAKNSESKLSIIFGAGASYGYSSNKDFEMQPPTVSKLLDLDNDLVKFVINKPQHADIKSQRAYLERRIRGFNGDLEAYLSDLYARDTDDNLFPLMLRYLEDLFKFASLQIDLNDNYYQSFVSIVRELRGSKKWSILTFNYDTVLEQSLGSLPRFVPNLSFNTDNEYLEQNPKVLKIHGGINFRYVSTVKGEKNRRSYHDIFSEMMNSHQPIENFMQLINKRSDYDFETISWDEDTPIRVYDFPLMMIPIHTLPGSENTFFERQIEYAKNEILESQLVIAIGYQFGDNIFTNALSKLDLKKNKLILVGSKSLITQTVESKAYIEAAKMWPEENIYICEEEGFGAFVNALY